MIAAGVTIAMLPVVVLYLLLQRRFIEGITAGALKSWPRFSAWAWQTSRRRVLRYRVSGAGSPDRSRRGSRSRPTAPNRRPARRWLGSEGRRERIGSSDRWY